MANGRRSETPVVDYVDVYHAISQGRSHLLLGNGFSIGCDPVFQYASLYERAVEKGLSRRAQEVFRVLGTNNFEGVMQLLSDSHWVARTYGLIEGEGSGMLEDLEVVKTALVEAIADSHLEHSARVSDERKRSAAGFFEPYYNIFTTNYDLLAYWVVMSADGALHIAMDSERIPKNLTPRTSYSRSHVGGQKGLFYLHGGLHLYVNDGIVTKHCWNRSGEPLTTLIRRGMSEAKYPLFVAEGTANGKLRRIHQSSYLSYALDKFGRIENRLVVFGHSLGPSDDHLRRAIAGIRRLRDLYIGVRDEHNTTRADEATAAIRALRREYGHPDLNITYFRAASAHVWDA